MSDESSSAWGLVIVLFFIFIFLGNPQEKNIDNSPFIVKCPNGKTLFLNMDENEIAKRLGKEIETYLGDFGSYHQYIGLTIRCNDGKVDVIRIASREYSIITGLRIGHDVSRLPGNKTLFGYLYVFNSELISNNQLVQNGNKGSIEYGISTRDNLGNKRLLAGEVVDDNDSSYNLLIHTENSKVASIDLYKTSIFQYNAIEIPEPEVVTTGVDF